jgi:ABC-type sugar transport system ATPase subunit
MRRPGILLLDRTIAEADPDVQELMRKEFVNINRELGITVIYATDNQKTAMALGTRMIVMNEGEICQEDSAQNIYDHPERLFVAGFFGTPRMDLSIAKVLEENGNIILKFASGKIRLSFKETRLCRKRSLHRRTTGKDRSGGRWKG